MNKEQLAVVSQLAQLQRQFSSFFLFFGGGGGGGGRERGSATYIRPNAAICWTTCTITVRISAQSLSMHTAEVLCEQFLVIKSE